MGNTFRREDIHAQYLLPSRRNGVSAWDNEIVRRMVLDRKLAPFYPGAETNHECPDAEECPICFLYYRGGLNRSRCCKKPICTECYLQICAPDAPHTSCPFCMRPGYSVRYCGPLSHREIEAMRLEEERVTQLQLNAIRSQNESSPRPNVQSPQTSRTDAGAGQERAAPSPLMHDMGNLSELERYMIAEAVRRSLLEVSGTSVLLDLEDGDEESINAEWMSQVLVENPNIRTQHERSRTSPGPSHQQRVCSGAQSSDQGPSFYQDPELFYDLPEQRTSSNRTLHPEDFLPDVLENIPQVLRNQFSLHKYKNVQRKNPPPADSVGPTISTVQDESRVRIHSQSQGNRPPPNPNRLTLPPPLQNTTIDDLLGILSSERRRSLPQYLLQVGPSNQGTEPRGNHPN